MWRAVHPVLWCQLFFTIYPGKKKTWNILNMTLSVYCPYLCNQFVQQTMVSLLYQMLRIMYKKERFHDSPVQLVKNKHPFPSSAIVEGMLHSSANIARKRKIWYKTRFRCYLPLCTKDQGGLLGDKTVRKVTHYPQITKFPRTISATSRMCTAVPQAQ